MTDTDLKHSLFLVIFDRGADWKNGSIKPYHWALFVEDKHIDHKWLGWTYQLRGMPGGFYYEGKSYGDLLEIPNKKDETEIGTVELADLDVLHEVLSVVQIVRDEESAWNCQDWTMTALDALKEKGFIHQYIEPAQLKAWFREQ